MLTYMTECLTSQRTINKEPTNKQQDPRSCVRVVYIAGDSLHHQPMGAGHMTVLQLHGPMAFCVLQWCHPMPASTKRTSCCTRIITLYGTWEVDSGPHKLISVCFFYVFPRVCFDAKKTSLEFSITAWRSTGFAKSSFVEQGNFTVKSSSLQTGVSRHCMIDFPTVI